ncbi:Putative uncharacterized protein [Moritella viscosa]|nr:Putative uncharacterized protein [Moritella viscosa]
MRKCLKIGKPTILHKLTLDTDLLEENTGIYLLINIST